MKFRNVTFAASAMFAALAVPLQLAAQVDGSGTTDFVPRWTDSTTQGNSNISDIGGVVAVIGKNGTAASPVSPAGNAPAALRVTGGLGGGTLLLALATHGGTGGPIFLTSGKGGSTTNAAGGLGAAIVINGGGGFQCIPASTRCGLVGGNGGSISLQPGAGGGPAARSGNVMIATAGGFVGIHSTNPAATLDVGRDGTTLADEWTTRSSRRYKANIQPLQDALGKIEALQGVSYERKSDGRHEIGVIAEDVDRVIPEVVARDPETHEVEGVDYSRLVSVLIEAVKSQQIEIERLNAQVAQLTSDAPKRLNAQVAQLTLDAPKQ